jgi:predicted PurR-regulated permease PerM
MATSTPQSRDLARGTLAVVFILGLTAVSIWILSPFIAALIWATTLVVATWPILLWLQKSFGGKRKWAVLVMTGALGLLVLLPIFFGVRSVVVHSSDITAWVENLPNASLPSAPAWLAGMPVGGERLAKQWNELAAAGSAGVRAYIAPHGREILKGLMSRVGGVLLMFVYLLVTIIIAAALYGTGEKVAAGVLAFARRLGGSAGEDAARLAVLATRGVAMGVVVTALIQALLAGAGMAIAGVKFAGLLSVGVFVCCLAQLGPIPFMLIGVIMLYAGNHPVPATILLVWMIFVGTVDNIIRPLLIKRSVDLPLALIFSGVIGGLIAFGVLGLIVGPVVLAVAQQLIAKWIADGGEGAPSGA